ncbi:MAG TPA: cbb3-type cytochrome c oxidase subunit I, partial [Microthrixaceae bacterium]|nr:cbb3-type cytochrome c oxidase subunit I [Microthrixaceae bacterium]
MTVLERPAITSGDLKELWEDAPGLVGFFSTVDHKRIGMRYIYTSFFFFFLAGLMALLMRAQLSVPNSTFMGAQTYNEVMTMHGTTMIFLFNTPVLAGFGNYLIPLHLGTRDMAFPRLNAFSYWIFLLSGIFMYSSFFVGKVPDGGWFGYTPLTGRTFAPGINIDSLWVTIQFAFKAPGIAAEHGAAATMLMYFESFIEPFGTLWFIYLLPIFFVVTKLTRPLSPAIIWGFAAALEILPIHTGWTVIDEFASRFVYFYSGYIFAPYIFKT